MRLRHVAPAGAPIRVRDVLTAARLSVSGPDPSTALRAALRSGLGASAIGFASTGRAALTLILRALRDLQKSGRDEVIVPSYTCYSVPASVVKAGLKPRLVDIDPATLDYDGLRLERTDSRRVLAIIATNLYGLPNDLPALERFAQDRDLFLVDDAAQALGARVGGRSSGTWGHAGLYSFDKGKNISAMDGGVILSDHPAVAGALEGLVHALPEASHRAGIAKSLKLAGYVALLNPRAYWVPNAIPQLHLGLTEYRTDFPLERPGRFWLALARTMLARLDEFTAHRRAVAAGLRVRLESFSDLFPIPVGQGREAAYTRLPLLARSRQQRASLLEALVAAGIGASASYPASLLDVPQLSGLLVGDERDARGGRTVADRLITLPTHPHVTDRDLSTIESIAASVLATRHARERAERRAAVGA